MKMLVIGGSGFIGSVVVQQLLRRNHEVAILHRGSRVASLPQKVASITGDRRHLSALRPAIAEFGPAVVIDMILSSGRQSVEFVATCHEIVSRILIISSMDVYRACGVLYRSEPVRWSRCR